MSEKAPFSFSFSFNKRKHLSLILAVICIVAAMVFYLVENVVTERRKSNYENSHSPVLKADDWRKDFLVFHDRQGRFPKDLKELETIIWNKGDASVGSKLSNGNQYFLLENYLYIYNVESVKTNNQLCSLWAIPVGEFKQKESTYFFIITTKYTQTWKGSPLSAEDVRSIPLTALPLDTDMARLGLSKQLSEDEKSVPEKKSPLSKFNFGR